jgi:cell division protein FtsB
MKKTSNKYFKKWKSILFVLIVVGLGVWLVFGEHGYLYLKRQRAERHEYSKKVEELKQHKLKLEQEINRLKTDKKFLEDTIREETGKLKANEKMIIVKEKGQPAP